MAGKFARTINAQHLVVTHFGAAFSLSVRWPDPSLSHYYQADGGDRAAKEAQAEFGGPVTPAIEFLEVSLGRSLSEETGKSEVLVALPQRQTAYKEDDDEM